MPSSGGHQQTTSHRPRPGRSDDRSVGVGAEEVGGGTRNGRQRGSGSSRHLAAEASSGTLEPGKPEHPARPITGNGRVLALAASRSRCTSPAGAGPPAGCCAPRPVRGGRDTVNQPAPLRLLRPGRRPAARSRPTWPTHTVRAQAVAARTYAAFERDAAPDRPALRRLGHHEVPGVRRLLGRAPEVRTPPVAATQGRALTWHGDAPSPSSPRATAAGRQGQVDNADVPYLPAKQDPYDKATRAGRCSFTAAEMQNQVARHRPVRSRSR